MSIKKKAFIIFASIQDVGAMLMSIVYLVYVTLLLVIPIGTMWLNYTILGLSIVYTLFFLVKIFYINRLDNAKIIRLSIKNVYKYVKYFMKFINMTVIIITIVQVQQVENSHFVQIAGMIVLVLMFTINLVWDIGVFFLKRKGRRLLAIWKSLTAEEKQQKIDSIVNKALDVADSSSAVEGVINQGMHVRQIMDNRAQARREAEEAERIRLEEEAAAERQRLLLEEKEKKKQGTWWYKLIHGDKEANDKAKAECAARAEQKERATEEELVLKGKVIIKENEEKRD
ncbi:MAG: hypothetical protein FWD89_04735 [Firmicutes bacterium]|nr:hypothetical protein [Bacillota bacterium]MCL2771587.1 hypothetical protein [Bacillota bacterium]